MKREAVSFSCPRNIVMSLVAACLCIVTGCLLSACSKSDDDPEPVPDEDNESVYDDDPESVCDTCYAPSRTILVYMVAENSLARNAESDVNEILAGMKDTGLWKDDRVVVYLDDTDLPRYYVIDKNTKAAKLSELSPVYSFVEDVNSSSAAQLGAALDFVKSRYAASSYGLVMWSHSSGWIPSNYSGDAPATDSPRRSFGIDNGHNTASSSLSGNQMNIDDMASVIEEKGGVDFIFFDACFMQCIEVDYALRRATKYVIASPAEVPGPGANYATLIPSAFKAQGYSEQMVKSYYDYYVDVNTEYGIVISAVKTDGLEAYAAYVKSLLSSRRDSLCNSDFSSVQNYFRFGKWSRLYPDFYDMKGVMKNLLSDSEYATWETVVQDVVICTLHDSSWYSSFNGTRNEIDPEQCCGVTMFIPLSKYETWGYNESYMKTEWSHAIFGE